MKNLLLKYLVISYFFFFIFSCTLNNEPKVRDNYSIIFNLITNAKYQKLYIYNTLNNSDNIPSVHRTYPIFFCNDAQIKINTDNYIYNNFTFNIDTTKVKCPYDTMKVCIANIEKYYKNNIPFAVIPKNTYELSININDITITGSTIVPDDFQLITPTENQTFYYNDKGIVEIPIKWRKSLNALGYTVNMGYVSDSRNTVSYTLTDTSYTFFQDYEKALNRKGNIKIEILAFDRNFYEHIIQKVPSAGIEGAYGYFGSSVLKTVTVQIK